MTTQPNRKPRRKSRQTPQKAIVPDVMPDEQQTAIEVSTNQQQANTVQISIDLEKLIASTVNAIIQAVSEAGRK